MSMTGTHFSSSLVFAGVLAMGGAVLAETTWTNTDAGDWLEAGNWDNGVPGAGVDAVVDGGTAQLEGTGAAGQLTIGLDAPGMVDILNGGVLTLDGPRLHVGRGAEGTLNVDDGEIDVAFFDFNLTSSIRVGSSLGGGQDGVGTMNVSGDNASISTFGMIQVGQNDDAEGRDHGTLNVTGGDISTGSRLEVGSSGTGVATFDDADLSVASRLTVGDQTGGLGTLTFTSSDVQIGEDIQVGRGGGDGSVTMLNSVVNVDNRIRLGGSGSGTMTVDDDTQLSLSRMDMADDGDPAGSGTFILESGTVTLDEDIRMANSGPGTATVTVRDGLLDIASRIRMAGDDGASHLVIEGGQVDIGDRIQALDAGHNTIDVSGGSLSTVNDIRFVDDPGGTGAFTVSDGTVNVGNRLRFAREGEGTFSQSGGTVNIGEDFRLAEEALGTATATISGGQMNISNNLRIGMGGAAEFTIAGGQVDVDGEVRVEGSQLTLTGGTLTTGGDVRLDHSTLHLQQSDAFHVATDYSQDDDSTLIIELLSGTSQGITADGNLSIGGALHIVHHAQFEPDPNEEIVILAALDGGTIDGAFSEIVLDGFISGDLVSHTNGEGDVTALAMTNLVIPEPASLMLLGLGGLTLLARRRTAGRGQV